MSSCKWDYLWWSKLNLVLFALNHLIHHMLIKILSDLLDHIQDQCLIIKVRCSVKNLIHRLCFNIISRIRIEIQEKFISNYICSKCSQPNISIVIVNGPGTTYDFNSKLFAIIVTMNWWSISEETRTIELDEETVLISNLPREIAVVPKPTYRFF